MLNNKIIDHNQQYIYFLMIIKYIPLTLLKLFSFLIIIQILF